MINILGSLFVFTHSIFGIFSFVVLISSILDFPQVISRYFSTIFDDYILDGFVILTSLSTFNIIHNSHTFEDFTENNMFSIQMRGFNSSDKELGSIGIWSGISHT